MAIRNPFLIGLFHRPPNYLNEEWNEQNFQIENLTEAGALLSEGNKTFRTKLVGTESKSD